MSDIISSQTYSTLPLLLSFLFNSIFIRFVAICHGTRDSTEKNSIHGRKVTSEHVRYHLNI